MIKDALHKMEQIVRGLKNSTIEERLLSYHLIVTLLSEVEEGSKDGNYPNYKIYKQDLLASCSLLCGLGDGGNHDDGEHIGRALLAIRRMGSYSCFNVDHHYI